MTKYYKRIEIYRLTCDNRHLLDCSPICLEFPINTFGMLITVNFTNSCKFGQIANKSERKKKTEMRKNLLKSKNISESKKSCRAKK